MQRNHQFKDSCKDLNQIGIAGKGVWIAEKSITPADTNLNFRSWIVESSPICIIQGCTKARIHQFKGRGGLFRSMNCEESIRGALNSPLTKHNAALTCSSRGPGGVDSVDAFFIQCGNSPIWASHRAKSNFWSSRWLLFGEWMDTEEKPNQNAKPAEFKFLSKKYRFHSPMSKASRSVIHREVCEFSKLCE